MSHSGTPPHRAISTRLLICHSQRASEHARSVNATLAAHYGNAQAAAAAYKGKGIDLTRDAQARVHMLSANILTELEKLQVSSYPVCVPILRDHA